MSETKKFGARTTAMEVIEGHDLTGKEIIVTGAASGIGVETVRAFAKAGARVIIGARDMKRAEQIAQDLRKDTGNDKIEVEKIELDCLESVNEFVKRFLAKNRPLHILVNNAGIMACPLAYTKDGFESQFGTNHMGHFALTIGLMPALIEAYKQTGKKSKVISLASLAHVMGGMDFNDLNYKNGRVYDAWQAYGQSKTANILFSVGLTKLYADKGVISNALMPGAIMTGLQKHLSDEEKIKMGIMDKDGNINPHFKTIEQGASTTVWAAVAPEFDDVGGLYLEDCQISVLRESYEEAFKYYSGHLKYALDEADALKLWQASLELLKNPPK